MHSEREQKTCRRSRSHQSEHINPRMSKRRARSHRTGGDAALNAVVFNYEQEPINGGFGEEFQPYGG